MRAPLYTRLPDPVKQALLRAFRRLPAGWRSMPGTRRATALAIASERWTAAQRREYADGQIRRVVRHAYEHVPYYRETWRAAGVRPDDVTGVTTLAALPTINNRIVSAHFDDLVARDGPPWRRVLATTGGTTGAPTRLLIDKRLGSSIEAGHIAAMWARVGYRLGDRRVLLRGAVVDEKGDGALYRYDHSVDGYWFSNFHLTDESLGELVALMRRFRPRFLHTYPSSATMLARYVLRTGVEIPPLAAVLASSENMYPGQRELIETALRTRLFTWYGHSERMVLAGECEESTDYHVFPAYGGLELIDPEGRRVEEPGGAGEIVGTTFHNPVMPLIRYATGDWATFAGERCQACGRELTLVRDVRGHYWQELIVGSAGQLIAVTAVNVHDDTFDHVRQNQFHQSERGAITLRVVRDHGYGAADEARIRERLAPRLGGLRLQFEYVDAIPTTGPGKWKYLVQDLPEGRLGGDGVADVSR